MRYRLTVVEAESRTMMVKQFLAAGTRTVEDKVQVAKKKENSQS